MNQSEKAQHAHTETFIEECRYDTAQPESHIPGLIAVKAALRLKAAEEIKTLLSKSSPHSQVA